MTEPRVLSAALLWARNHIDLAVYEATKGRAVDVGMLDFVIDRLDKVLENREPSGNDMRAFHDFYGISQEHHEAHKCAKSASDVTDNDQQRPEPAETPAQIR